MKWLKVIAKAGGSYEILIYDMIGEDWFSNTGILASAYAESLKKIPRGSQIDLRINSPGGNVWDGTAIYHLNSARRDEITVHVDGIAASIASVIALSGKKLVMPRNALLMIHDPRALGQGTSDDLRKMAEDLDLLANNMADIYRQKSGKSVGVIREKMKQETYFTGETAHAFGFADEVGEPMDMAAGLKDYRHYSTILREQRVTAANNPGDRRSQENEEQNTTMKMKVIILALLAHNGVKPADDATDATIIAELDKLVAAKKISKEDRDRLVDPPTTTPLATLPAPAPALPTPPNPPNPPPNPGPGPQATVVTLSTDQWNAIQGQISQVAVERNARITASFDNLVSENPSIDRAVWLPRVLADERILSDLSKLPGRMPAPLGFSRVQMVGDPLVEKYRSFRSGMDRLQFRLENEQELLKKAHILYPEAFARASFLFGGPQMANTLSATLVTDYLGDGLLIIANNKLAPLGLFSRNFGVDPLKPRATVDVPKATAGATAQTNPTNWETGDSTLGVTQVTVNQISQSFHLTNDQLNKGFQMQQLAAINADIFGNAISDVWTAIDIAGNFGAAQVIGLSTAFDPADLPAIFATAKNFRMRNLLLDGAYIGYLFPGVTTVSAGVAGIAPATASVTVWPGAFGFDNIAMQNRWTGATANSVGFLCGPDAIAVGSGLPIGQPPGEFISLGTTTLEGAGTLSTSLGITIQIAVWYSRATRTIWASYDVMFGAGPGETGQGKGLVSA